MKPITRIGFRYSGPIYAAGMVLACITVVVLAVAGTPSH